MLKSVKNLVNGNARVQGNHRIEISGNIEKYYYHSTAICTVDNNKRTVHYDNGGWNTASTNRAINSYKQCFNHYTEI